MLPRSLTSVAAAKATAITTVAGHGRDYRDDRRRDDYRRDDWRRDDHRRDDNRYRGGWYDSRDNHHRWGKGDYFRYRPSYSNYVVVNDYHRLSPAAPAPWPVLLPGS